MAEHQYGSRYDLLQCIVDPTSKQRLNLALLDENVELREFAAEIEWLAPDPRTGKELKDAAWETIGLRPPSPQAAGWWPASGPTWDGVARVRGLPRPTWARSPATTRQLGATADGARWSPRRRL